jgi:fatty acid desaturase
MSQARSGGLAASERSTASAPMFKRLRVTRRDQAVFVGKLVVAAALVGGGVALVLTGSTVGVICGIILLGVMYPHLVELQHQCLHQSAFVGRGLHRPVGVLLGLPLLVSYSHYRIRHLQHHRFLGTDRDSEFFGFEPRRPLTVRALLGGLFDYKRLVSVASDCYCSWRGTWQYTGGTASAWIQRNSITEYRLISLAVLAACAAAATGHGLLVLQLWVAPLLVATPLHFLVELPEHVCCDNDTTDVLRNTRSIRGSWFSTWYTNGNNLHVEHHAAMTVPINRLRERHDEVQRIAKYVERSYWSFYGRVLHEVVANSRRPSNGRRHATS